MTDGQSALGDFGVDTPEREETADGVDLSERSMVRLSRRQLALKQAPEGAEPDNPLSCPWCLGSPDDFVKRTSDDAVGELIDDPQISCGNCRHVIPTTAEWYLRGEKMCY